MQLTKAIFGYQSWRQIVGEQMFQSFKDRDKRL